MRRMRMKKNYTHPAYNPVWFILIMLCVLVLAVPAMAADADGDGYDSEVDDCKCHRSTPRYNHHCSLGNDKGEFWSNTAHQGCEVARLA